MAQIDDQPLSVNVVLSRILSRTNQYLNSRPFVPASSPVTPPNIHIDLPEPPPILPALVAAGAKPEVAQAMQTAYHKRACEFRERALATMSRAYSKLARIPHTSSHPSDESIVTAFKQAYFNKLNSWICESVNLLQAKGPSVLCYREDDEGPPVKTSKTFNHQYVPLLEHFFEETHFPTHADKVFLAKKSNMTYRQIHVWFQNRRNRAKKALHKKPVSEEGTIPLDPVIHKVGKFAVLPTTKSDAPPNCPSIPIGLPPVSLQQRRHSPKVSSPTAAFDELGGVPPHHAFPTTYPPSCEYDPFPSAPIFAVPEWPRRTIIPSQHPRQSNIDIDELTEKFSRLNVRDDFLSQARRKAGKVTCDGLAATFAITVRPSPAPHPACIRTPATPPAPPRIVCRPIPAPASALHVFRSPSPDSPMTTLIPPHTHRRKIAPMPKRIPSEPPFTHGQKSSGGPNGPPSLTSSTRSSSVGSETSMEGSRSSNPSSAVTTPESSPSPLSHPP